MAGNRSVEEMLAALHDDLMAAGFTESELPDDLSEIIGVFCRHKRIIRVLLTLCGED